MFIGLNSGARGLQPGGAWTSLPLRAAAGAQPDGRDGEEDSRTTQASQVSNQQ